MSEKKKLKHEAVGQIRYYWNRASLSRRFDVTVDAPPQAVADQFYDVEQIAEGEWIPRRRVVDVVESPDDGSHVFQIRVRHRLPIGIYTTIKAKGRITYSQGYEQTVVQGDIRLGWFFCMTMAMIGPLIGIWMSILIGIRGIDQPIISLGLLFTAFIVTLINRDYETLITQIRTAINDSQREHVAHQRMKQHDDVTEHEDNNPFEHIKVKRVEAQRADVHLLDRKQSAKFIAKK